MKTTTPVLQRTSQSTCEAAEGLRAVLLEGGFPRLLLGAVDRLDEPPDALADDALSGIRGSTSGRQAASWTDNASLQSTASSVPPGRLGESTRSALPGTDQSWNFTPRFSSTESNGPDDVLGAFLGTAPCCRAAEASAALGAAPLQLLPRPA